MKYVLVSGGVISGIGKGIIASSTGLLLKTIGLKVTSIKIDPYINLDAGTMAPTEHGEVFTLDDGGEVDLDLGNYERYLSISLSREHNLTTGKIYRHVIERERRGDYLGKTVQVVPHLTDSVQDWIERVAKIPVDETRECPDVCIIELGGTVGDIESGPFVESLRQMRRRAGKDNFLHIHTSLIPVIHGEQKTKPTQQAIRDVRSAGLFPDLIACRCSAPLEKGTTEKLAMFCQVDIEQVIAVHDVSSTYHVPLLLEKQGLIAQLEKILRLDAMQIPPKLQERGATIWKQWKVLTCSKDEHYDQVTIVLVGKYTSLKDSYLSCIKALEHAAMANRRKLNLLWIDASHLEAETRESAPAEYHKAWHQLCTAQGIFVPGGFGTRGTEGMIAAANWARTNNTPYLGVCLGMQMAVIEYARNVCDIPKAASAESTRIGDTVIVPMEDIDQEVLGGTMRLGMQPTIFEPDTEWSKLRTLYDHSKALADPHASDGKPLSPRASLSKDSRVILERHRHRYEVNPAYIDRLQKSGMYFIGKDDKGVRMEIVELKSHPFYVGVQFHPEYLSRVLEPSKPYLGFVAASGGCLAELLTRAKRKQSLINGNSSREGIEDLVNGLGGITV